MKSGREVVLTINGAEHRITVPVEESLVATLNGRLGLWSVRPTCGVGMCGTCTVQLDGEVASACLLLTSQVDGRAIRTSEGLIQSDGALSRVQRAFVDRGAYQCAYCIPGMAISVDALFSEQPDASVQDVRDYLSGNLCRCGTYVSILEAVTDLVGAAEEGQRPEESSPDR